LATAKKTSLSGIISSDKKRLQKLVFLIGTKYATQTDSLGSIVSILLREIIKYKLQQQVFK
jgi:hypothetical protein